jgi:hypothetical protein
MRNSTTRALSCSPGYRIKPFSHKAWIRVLVPAALIFLAAGCAGSRELTRGRAAEMVGNSTDFRAPVSLPLKKETDLLLRPESDGETESQARFRATETYFQATPQMDVLRQIGLVDVRAAIRKRPGENHGVWSFDVEPFLTERGEKTAAAWQVEQAGQSIALARREIVEVTGITKSGDAAAQAQYTWRETATEAGQAFVPGTPEYERLPASLRQLLEERHQTKDYGKTKRGMAVFQLFDDGWRLTAVR